MRPTLMTWMVVLGLAGASVLGAAAFAWPVTTSAWVLVAGWLACSLALGAQANLWIHDLTGGSWGTALRPHLKRARSTWPLISLLLVIAVGLLMPLLYPWAQDSWVPDTAKPHFQTIWLSSSFFFIRLLLAVLVLNAVFFLLPRHFEKQSDETKQTGHRRAGLAAAGLLVWASTVSLMGVDLIMSLAPSWYSSGFGLVLLAAQLKFGLAWATMKAAPHTSAPVRRDLGNLLLAYVLMWAYLEWVQFQIIWAENLPDEIGWYVVRLDTGWGYLALALVVFGLAAPLFLLLFRAVKENALALQATAALLCLMAVAETTWLILPSVGAEPASSTPQTSAGLNE